MQPRSSKVGPSEQLGVRVTVYNEVEGTTTDLFFPRLPVRVGRNKLNDLVLNHRYVSQWHAVLGLGGDGLTLTQVGSSNSVVVGERRLQPNEELTLPDNEPVRVVPFVLYVQLMQLPPQIKTAAASPYDSVAAVAQAAADGHSALEQVALQVLDRLSESLLGRRIDDPAELARFGARLGQILRVFLRCFIALQRGQQEFREALDIKGLRSGMELPAARVELSTVLFTGGPEVVEALEHAFKDVMIHQVALLSGLMAGVRTLLGKLSPRAVTKEATKQRRSPSIKQLWETYQLIHRDLAEEDNETFETIFGSQFSKAYAKLAGDPSPRKR